MLLDTQVLLWLLSAPSRLGPHTTAALRTTSVFYSPVSTAEIEVKRMLGKLDVPADLVDRLDQQGLTPLPLHPNHTRRIRDFPELVRHDPFDRLLLAQALSEDLGFLTADTRLLDLGLAWILDAER